MSTASRLPRTVLPSLYNILINPDLINFTFSGKVDINSVVNEPCRFVRLNSRDLEITKAAIIQGNKTLPATWEYNIRAQTLDLLLQDDLPIDARRAFPCFDEPDMKAQFRLSIISPPNRTEVEKTTVLEDGRLLKEFGTTPRMSTYLVAYIIGDFEYVERRSDRGVRIRIYTPVGRTEEGMYALDVAVKSLSFYENFFDLEYPLPKLDLVPVPKIGAMENWGLVTFRETTILVDQTLSSARTKSYVTTVVAHELAHMWFGNLVTMWTDLWLNEGFATFMEYFCSSRCYPEYNFQARFITGEFMDSMNVDTRLNTHPVEVAVDDPSKIDEIFDEISYSKGASVIAMLFYYIGEAGFRTSLRSYLTKYSYQNTETRDLWNSFKECGFNVEGIMNTFIHMPGYPVVSVSCDSAQDGSLVMVLEQKRFTLLSGRTGSETFENGERTFWNIPVGYTTESGAGNINYVLLEQPRQEFALRDVNDSQWIKLNAGVHGFFRVQYSAPLFAKLLDSVSNIPINDCISLLSDTYALVFHIVLFQGLCGYIPMEMLFRLTEMFTKTYELSIWEVISDFVRDITRIVSGTPVDGQFTLYVRRLLMSGIFQYVGWDVQPNETHEISLLRNVVFGMMARYGDDQFQSQCRQVFERILQTDASVAIVDPNILLPVS
ncbi:puromycin-sensitive aminopeptidase-like [Octopus sinensis]|uniref:Puromycin-sensitive aminopeptidase-like n=1 Tax=Octopus sinensis TaxID=2607531 RepID=A0A6P7U903_9MOLL|nr:puromycin-sensitive aminopeptidase-like [Octopus sinensis]